MCIEIGGIMCIEKKERIVADKDFIVYKVVRVLSWNRKCDNEYSFVFGYNDFGLDIDDFGLNDLYMCVPPTEHGYSAFLSLSDAVEYMREIICSLHYSNLTILEIKIRKNDVYWKGKIIKRYISDELNSAIVIMSPVEIGDEVW